MKELVVADETEFTLTGKLLLLAFIGIVCFVTWLLSDPPAAEGVRSAGTLEETIERPATRIVTNRTPAPVAPQASPSESFLSILDSDHEGGAERIELLSLEDRRVLSRWLEAMRSADSPMLFRGSDHADGTRRYALSTNGIDRLGEIDFARTESGWSIVGITELDD